MIKKRGDKKSRIFLFIICLIITYAAAAIGGIFTSSGVNSDWYDSIRPSITPPNYVFPIAWNILFFLIALSIYFAWVSAKNAKQKKIIIAIFGINLTLNILWSVLFFGLKNPLFGFIDIIAVWLSILIAILILAKINKISAYLLIPYLLWVSFASIINYVAI